MNKIRLRKMILTSLFVVIIAACSWISFPFPITGIPITLQTLAVFLSLYVIGGKWSSIAVVIYIVLGILGVPVFSGFKSGIGVIIGPTGGYIIGFIFMTLLYWLMEVVIKKDKIWIKILTQIVGLILCYTFGTIWFVFVYTHNTGDMSFGLALSYCVIPYIIPDLAKLIVATTLSIPINILKTKYLKI